MTGDYVVGLILIGMATTLWLILMAVMSWIGNQAVIRLVKFVRGIFRIIRYGLARLSGANEEEARHIVLQK